MKSAKLMLEERECDWTLAIEPWAVGFDVPAGTRVHVEIFEDEEHFCLEISNDGASLAFQSAKFHVWIGDEQHAHDFGTRCVFEGGALATFPS